MTLGNFKVLVDIKGVFHFFFLSLCFSCVRKFPLFVVFSRGLPVFPSHSFLFFLARPLEWRAGVVVTGILKGFDSGWPK